MAHENLNTTDFHLPCNPQLVQRAKQLRQSLTPAEEKLWQNYLRMFPFRVLRQRPIHHFIVDSYCAALKLVIEIDGESHFTEHAQMYDEERTQILEGYGLIELRFTNDEVINQFEKVCLQIQRMIPPTPFLRGLGGSSLISTG
jgi:very-short-patch-repair endonuclease